MRIAFSQINPILGNIVYNQALILRDIDRASKRRVKLIIFPEMSLIGYMPQDLLDQELLLKKSERALTQITKKIPQGIEVFLGTIRKNKNNRLINALVHLSKDKIKKTIPKTLLPNYDVFDEARYYEAGDLSKNIIRIGGKKILCTVCEDLWYFHPDYQKIYPNIFKNISLKEIDYVINISASPYTKSKAKQRQLLLKRANEYFKKPILYVNLVGAEDSIVFDGFSQALDKKGKTISQSLGFQEDLNIVDFEKNEGGKRHQPDKKDSLAEIHQALVSGLKDYVLKSGFKHVHLGLSGGIDSALVAALAVDALGASNVTCIAMPTKFNAKESLDLAKKLSENLNVEFYEVPIEKYYQSMIKDLEEIWQLKSFGTTHENLQSRIRGLILMSYANAKNSMLLATGNKSEYATGYSTLYGDMCGGLAPIGDLLKTEVYKLSKWYNKEYEIIPKRIIERKPSAELKPNQHDQESLPAYEKLDRDLENFIVKDKILKGEEGDWLMKLVYANEFKRFQAAPILKISDRAFGIGRRYPLVQDLLNHGKHI